MHTFTARCSWCVARHTYTSRYLCVLVCVTLSVCLSVSVADIATRRPTHASGSHRQKQQRTDLNSCVTAESSATCCGWRPQQQSHACSQPCVSPRCRQAAGRGSWRLCRTRTRCARPWWPDYDGDELGDCQAGGLHSASCGEDYGVDSWVVACGLASRWCGKSCLWWWLVSVRRKRLGPNRAAPRC